MTIQSWLMYLALVTVATATPGPAVLFIMTSLTLHGWQKAYFAALGNIVGLLCLGILAVTGLGTILKTSELIFTLMIFSFSFLMLYALLAYNAKIWLTKPNRINAINRTSGSIFIGFGFLLATSSNK